VAQAHRLYLLAGVSGLVGGALSMAVGEFISVSSSRDAELVDIKKESDEQKKGPAAQARELAELAGILESKGLSAPLAVQAAEELTAKDVVRAHALFELGIEVDSVSSPIQAAVASCCSFLLGAGLPLLSSGFIRTPKWRIMSLVLSCVTGLVASGFMGAHLADANRVKGVARVLTGGVLSLGITYAVGRAFEK
jgi:VIT1/CCC1 family predicted Fe2+/Mn2+ transporter